MSRYTCIGSMTGLYRFQARFVCWNVSVKDVLSLYWNNCYSKHVHNNRQCNEQVNKTYVTKYCIPPILSFSLAISLERVWWLESPKMIMMERFDEYIGGCRGRLLIDICDHTLHTHIVLGSFFSASMVVRLRSATVGDPCLPAVQEGGKNNSLVDQNPGTYPGKEEDGGQT